MGKNNSSKSTRRFHVSAFEKFIKWVADSFAVSAHMEGPNRCVFVTKTNVKHEFVIAYCDRDKPVRVALVHNNVTYTVPRANNFFWFRDEIAPKMSGLGATYRVVSPWTKVVESSGRMDLLWSEGQRYGLVTLPCGQQVQVFRKLRGDHAIYYVRKSAAVSQGTLQQVLRFLRKRAGNEEIRVATERSWAKLKCPILIAPFDPLPKQTKEEKNANRKHLKGGLGAVHGV